jgi:hypothetical protein
LGERDFLFSVGDHTIVTEAEQAFPSSDGKRQNALKLVVPGLVGNVHAACKQRGIKQEDGVNMIVNGFCKEVFRELPMEFAVEAQKLLGVSLEGSVG